MQLPYDKSEEAPGERSNVFSLVWMFKYYWTNWVLSPICSKCECTQATQELINLPQMIKLLMNNRHVYCTSPWWPQTETGLWTRGWPLLHSDEKQTAATLESYAADLLSLRAVTTRRVGPTDLVKHGRYQQGAKRRNSNTISQYLLQLHNLWTILNADVLGLCLESIIIINHCHYQSWQLTILEQILG